MTTFKLILCSALLTGCVDAADPPDDGTAAEAVT